jgi:hypothetical protein
LWGESFLQGIIYHLTCAIEAGADEQGIGALHVVNNSFESTLPVNASALGGSALAIAYTSNYTSLSPNDMTIISVNYTSPWYRLTDYAIPANLPECPEGGCICTWNWVHLAGNGEGDGEEIVRPSSRSWVGWS